MRELVFRAQKRRPAGRLVLKKKLDKSTPGRMPLPKR
jgi:hypothetical protein